MSADRLERVAVVGPSGSGKTTFARSLSRVLGVPHIELDAHHWGPNWTPRPAEEFQASVQRAVSEDRWVSDGNYSAVRDRVWRRATALVWLNYGYPLVFARAVSRTFSRIVTREKIFAGNRESLRQILDPDWIPWWVVRSFWRRRRLYAELLRRPEYAHLRVLEFRNPVQASGLLASLGEDDG